MNIFPARFHLLSARLTAFCLLLLLASPLAAGPLRDKLKERQKEKLQERMEEEQEAVANRTLPAGCMLKEDVAYGEAPRQKMDVYLPAASAAPAPIIFMVHGGAWKYGDKKNTRVVDNKLNRYVPGGFIFISVNYRMLPLADPLEQLDDIARALAYVQAHAAEFHGDPSKVILMGHSAGAHLVSLLSCHPDLAGRHGIKPWLGTVSLDSATYNVVETMEHKHLKLYDEPFGTDKKFWRACSPYHVLSKPVPPILAVYSSQRDDSTAQARNFAAHATKLGSRVTTLGEDLKHSEINEFLGKPGAYTNAVENFLRALDPAVAALLDSKS